MAIDRWPLCPALATTTLTSQSANQDPRSRRGGETRNGARRPYQENTDIPWHQRGGLTDPVWFGVYFVYVELPWPISASSPDLARCTSEACVAMSFGLGKTTTISTLAVISIDFFSS